MAVKRQDAECRRAYNGGRRLGDAQTFKRSLTDGRG